MSKKIPKQLTQKNLSVCDLKNKQKMRCPTKSTMMKSVKTGALAGSI